MFIYSDTGAKFPALLEEDDYGGEEMAKETVDAVRQAELRAAQAEKDAAAKSEEIIKKAQQDAKELIVDMTKEAAKKADGELLQAREKSEKVMADALLRAEKEVLFLREMVKSKEKAAREMVISEVI